MDVPEGENSDNYIKKAIDNCATVFALINQKALKSEMVTGELIYANECYRKIIIFKEESVNRRDLPLFLRSTQYIKFNVKDIDDLLKTILECPWKTNPLTITENYKNYQSMHGTDLEDQLSQSNLLNEIKETLHKYNVLPSLNIESYIFYLKKIVDSLLKNKRIHNTDDFTKKNFKKYVFSIIWINLCLKGKDFY